MYFLIVILSLSLIAASALIVKFYIQWITALFIINDNHIDMDDAGVKHYSSLAIWFIIDNIKNGFKIQ